VKTGYGKKFREFSNALENINVEKEFRDAAKDLSELALDLNKVQMYELGIDAKGKKLGRYAYSTRVAKDRKGQRSDHITLRDTGEFQDAMVLDTKQIPVFIESKDSKVGIIMQRWPDALGLYPPFAEQFREKVGLLARQKIHSRIEKAKNKILQ
jgi:hypothetical protein